ncbi:hypothetical protein G7046_g7718 [Stylonectria norvegica]|nr:hypothetical protein G7046_g7718 [Stylonectria norvegica]
MPWPSRVVSGAGEAQGPINREIHLMYEVPYSRDQRSRPQRWPTLQALVSMELLSPWTARNANPVGALKARSHKIMPVLVDLGVVGMVCGLSILIPGIFANYSRRGAEDIGSSLPKGEKLFQLCNWLLGPSSPSPHWTPVGASVVVAWAVLSKVRA